MFSGQGVVPSDQSINLYMCMLYALLVFFVLQLTVYSYDSDCILEYM